MTQWYYSRDNKQKLGPFSAARLKELAASGELLPSDMVMREGSRKWAAAASIKGLFAKGTSADRSTSCPPPVTSETKAAEKRVRQGKHKFGRIANAGILVLLLLAVAEAVGLLLLKDEFDRRLTEMELQTQAVEKAKAALEQRLAESEQQGLEGAKARGDMEQRLAASDRQVQSGAKDRASLEERLGEAERRASQQAGKAASLEARLTQSERRVKEAATETVALQKRLAESEQKVQDSATAAAAMRRRLRLLAPASLSTYAIDQYALQVPPEAEESVASLAKYLTEPAENDREKVRAIFRWMTDRIAYDAEAFLARRFDDPSPAAVLKKRLCICGGYARLFEALCKDAGVEVACIRGYLKGYGYKPEDKDPGISHMWNAVKCGGQWHLVDVTLSAGYLEAGKFVKHFNELHFFIRPDQLVFTHLPIEAKWQLLDRPVSEAEFRKFAKVSQIVVQFPGATEELRRKLQDGSFRGFVKTYAYPELTRMFCQAPLAKHLSAGSKYIFRVESPDLIGMAVKNAHAWHPLTRKGNLFEGEVTAQKGVLQVVGQIPQKGKTYWWLLEYVVE